jgi:hypothetical protein
MGFDGFGDMTLEVMRAQHTADTSDAMSGLTFGSGFRSVRAPVISLIGANSLPVVVLLIVPCRAG